MNEQRTRAYHAAIQELLNCRSRQEVQVLNQYPELLDRGLVQTMVQVIEVLQSQGRKNDARFLRKVAQELVEWFNSQSSSGQPDGRPGREHDPFLEYTLFFDRVMHAIIDGEPSLYTLFAENQDKLDVVLEAIIRGWYSCSIDPNNAEKNEGPALIVYQLAVKLYDFPLGDRESNLEIVIACFELALQVFTCQNCPKYWANTQHHLGGAYSSRVRGERAENIEKAIACCQAALQFFTRQHFPHEYATILTNLGTLYYTSRVCGEKAENLEHAIACYEAALQVPIEHHNPESWAMAQMNLGAAYSDRIRGDKSQNMEQAIYCYQQALQVYTRETFPEDWANTQNNLGSAYSKRIRGDRSQNLEQSLYHYKTALQVHTREQFPQEWARAQFNLGLSYDKRIQGAKWQNTEQAISCLQTALQVYTYTNTPKEWAATQNVLGNAYSDRFVGNQEENQEMAIACYQAALQVRTRAAFPEDWAMAQHNLGAIYSNRLRGDRGENLEKAIACYQAALQVYTPASNPHHWADTQNVLGNAYNKRILGDDEENQEMAIACYQAALQVRTRAALPKKWAETQHNLGIAYFGRIRGNQAENQEQAIVCHKLALQVATKETSPHDWATTYMSLGLIYSDRIRGDRTQNIEQAISCHEKALQVATREGSPQDWANSQHSLGIAYTRRVQGELGQNLETAIDCFKAALQVYTRENFPKDWAETQVYLAQVYAKRTRGMWTENLDYAIDYFKAAVRIYTRQRVPEEWARIQTELANAYMQRGREENFEKAIACLRAASTVYTAEAFPEDWARVQSNFAVAYYKRIRGEKAQNLEYAIAHSTAALQIYTREDFPKECAIGHCNLGGLYSARIQGDRSQNLEKAILYCKFSLEIYTGITYLEKRANALRQLGFAYLDLARYLTESKAKNTAFSNAYYTFQQAIDIFENLRRQIISGEEAKRQLNKLHYPTYRGIVEVCLEQGNYITAIEYINRSKARNLVELIANRNVYAGENIPLNVQQRLQYLHRVISSTQHSHENLDYLNGIREEMWQLSPYQPLDFRQIQNLLDGETAILEWYVITDTLLAFLIFPASSGRKENRSNILLWQSSPEDLDQLRALIKDYWQNYHLEQPKWRNNLSQYLLKIGQILQLDGIVTRLFHNFPECKKLILSPHRYLNLLPIHTVSVTYNNKTQPLQDFFAKGVKFTANCQLLKETKQPASPRFDRLFAIQNPTKDLKFSDIEVTVIQDYFQSCHILKHEKAEKTSLNFSNAECIHFSCHGSLDPKDSIESSLLLANGELTLAEIVQLDLTQCSLVTLSACETGAIDIGKSEEYISLSSGFILAGAPNAVSSLWAVNDLSTALLMIRFYQNVKTDRTIALALRNAQRWLREATVEELLRWSSQLKLRPTHKRQFNRFKKMDATTRPFASPYYWAAFCAIGG